MINNIFITSEIDGLLYHNGKFISILKENYLPMEFLLSNKENIFSFYPICENGNLEQIKLIPYSISLDINKNNIECNNSNITLIKYTDNSYDLIFKSNYIEVGNKFSIKKSLKINNSIIKMDYSSFFQNNIIFYYNDYQFTFKSRYALQNIKLSSLYHEKNAYIILNAHVQKYEYMSVFAFDNEKITRLGEFLANKIELKENLLNTMVNLHDMAKHIIITKYKILNTNIIKLEKYLSSSEDKIEIKNKLLIPYAFLEAIQCEDYLLAKSYLSNALSQSLSEEHLKRFFGNIIDIKQPHNLKENFVALIYKENNAYIGKYCEFSFLDDKIDNINFL